MANHNSQIDGTARLVALQELWLRANRGIFARVALQLMVTPEAVRRVYRGLSTSERVARELRKRGAPLLKKAA